MKLAHRSLAFGLVGLGLFGVFGCSDSNEKEVLQATNASGKKAVVPKDAPTNAQDQYQQYQQNMTKNNPTANGYGSGSQGGGRR